MNAAQPLRLGRPGALGTLRHQGAAPLRSHPIAASSCWRSPNFIVCTGSGRFRACRAVPGPAWLRLSQAIGQPRRLPPCAAATGAAAQHPERGGQGVGADVDLEAAGNPAGPIITSPLQQQRSHIDRHQQQQQQQQRSQLPPVVSSALRTLGALAILLIASLGAGTRPAAAATATQDRQQLTAIVDSSRGSSGQASSSGQAEPSASAASARRGKAASASRRPASAAALISAEASPAAPAPLSGVGVPLGYDDIMRSMVYNPSDVPLRHTKRQIAEQLDALYSQYDNEDFDLGIKQFMIDQAIQQELEDGLDKKGGNEGFEEKISQALFADEEDEGAKEAIKTEDIASDAFTTEVAEEAMTLFGEPGSLSTAWRVQETLRDLSYTQFWTLVAEGRVDKVHFYGREQRSLLAWLGPSAPDGARTVKVTVPPDPMLLQHLHGHGVDVRSGVAQDSQLHHAFIIQIVRYAFPFVFISGLFCILSWILEPMPNLMRPNEFLRYRRELLYIASKLNFRSPAREVNVDRNAPDFIAWEDINGIDEVKREIEQIIDYLQNPALLSQQGVARIGGVMLAGAPGTGKTLLAKSIAAESGVRMFTCSGTDFFDVFSNVGARRIRETFEKIRVASPAILFIDEFDALGAARGGQAGGDESASIINELLVQMDSFEDNNGVVILGATNRPGAIDAALVRPGRFDRVIYMPLPDARGRADILQVHARDKSVDPDINWYEVARTMAGYTGADCMGLMQRAARLAARQGRERIEEDDLYAAMENTSAESFTEAMKLPETTTAAAADGSSGTGTSSGAAAVEVEAVPETSPSIPLALRKAIAVYEAGKSLLAYITPGYPELARVSVCPFDLITGYTLFSEDEDKVSEDMVSRAELESQMVVNLAGRCAEKLVMGQSEVTTLGAADVFSANMIAREMVLSLGMSARMGLVDLMHVTSTAQETGSLLRSADNSQQEDQFFHHVQEMSTDQARVALAEVVELLEAAEAKAYYGLAVNWKPLEALVQGLLEYGVLQGSEVAHILESNGVIHFPDPSMEGFGWDGEDGTLKYPHKPNKEQSVVEAEDQRAMAAAAVGPAAVLSGVKADKWAAAGAGAGAGAAQAGGRAAGGWHWNMPYTMKKEVPDWYKKELERYMY